MKLAEALQERADLNTRIEQLKARLDANCIVQEGEKPQEDPAALLKELDWCIQRLEDLIAAINRTNAETVIEGETITARIARKDCLRIKIAAYRNLANSAAQVNFRARGSEIRFLPTVNVAELRRNVDRLSRDLRLLDNQLQAANWSIELKM